jgi:hypothetical protein
MSLWAYYVAAAAACLTSWPVVCAAAAPQKEGSAAILPPAPNHYLNRSRVCQVHTLMVTVHAILTR